MKKLVSIILTLCFAFLPANSIWPTDVQSEKHEGSILNLYSASEISSQLESENVDASNASAYEISVLIELEDVVSEKGLDFEAKHISTETSDVDAALEAHRNRVKEYYVEYNENIASTLGLYDYEYYVSYYSPYIEIVFDDLAEYSRCESELVSTISNPELVVSAFNTAIVYENAGEATIEASTYETNYLLSDAFEDIGVSDSLYTGNGVKVGIIDGDLPYIDNLKVGKYTMVTYDAMGMHSTVIASIIGGTSGIAEDVHFYCMTGGRSPISDCNLMIDTYGVNIINMSFGYEILGYYCKFDACIDYIVSNTGCTIVKSAGNEGDETKYITAPGCALNAITVGSVNKSQNISYKSSWNVTDAFLLKPDVVAPGERLWGIPNTGNPEDSHSGTSYAAPMVVGTIALLMEEFPALKTNPALVKSVLHLGAEKLPSQTDYFDQQAGFGLLNYQNMRDCLLELNYFNFTISTTAFAWDIVASNEITIPYLSQIFVNANSIINSSNTDGNPNRANLVYTDYSIKIFDLSTSTYVASSTIDSSVDYLYFTNNKQNNSSYRIDIFLEDYNLSGEIEAGAVAYEIVPHTHSYNRITYLNNSTHIKRCTCGDLQIAAHYVNREDIVDNRYVDCLGCGAHLDLNEDYADIVMSTAQVSVNGSYLLPSGIVVLVDEDVQSYLDGTLVFYHPDNVPATQ